MEIILTIFATGAVGCVCFFIGAKIGQMVVKGEKITTPTVVNPADAIRHHLNKADADIQQGKLARILQNIESYDGTGNGQKDI